MAKKSRAMVRMNTASPAVIGPTPFVPAPIAAVTPLSDNLPEWVKEEQWKEAKGSFAPMAQFSEAGMYTRGFFEHARALTLGERTQQIYEFSLADDSRFGVWGSTILDDRMLAAAPNRGDDVLIFYLGDVGTSKGLNPAKLFRVFVKRA